MKKLILTITGLLLLLSSCDNWVDLSDMGTVNIRLASDSGGRYIAGGTERVDEAILGFIEKDIMYNFDFIEEITDFDGQHLFTGIPVGDYSFMAMLLDEGTIISQAIKPVTIEAGANQIIVEMGPGFHFEINDLPFDMGDLKNDFSLSLSGNEITIGIPSAQLAEEVNMKIKSNAQDFRILDYNGIEDPDNIIFNYTNLETEDDYTDWIPFNFNPTLYRKFEMQLDSWDVDSTTTSYKVIFKEL